MNGDDLQELERRLRRLPLCGPSPELDARIAAGPVFRAACRTRRRLALGAMAAAALAGCCAAVLAVRSWIGPGDVAPPGPAASTGVAQNGSQFPSPSPVSAPLASQPVHIEQVWSAVTVPEVVAQQGAPPVQRFQRQVVRRIQVIDETRHVRIEWKIPSKETVELPLEYN